ncbi:MAG TPA: DUF2339 domain-containing protein [Vicinamibacterales bacterium]|nr:DUF2339 domain-containing protein [Vicinamibacterales bacterium]
MITLLLFVLLVVVFVRVRRAERAAGEALRRIEGVERQLARIAAARTASAAAEAAGAAAPPVGGRTPVPAAAPVGAPAPPAGAAVRPPLAPAVAAARPPRPALPPHPLPPATAAADLEQRIGGRWLLYLGLAAIILGVSYFVKFAFDNGWISEPLRVLAGLLAGAVLIAAGQRLGARGLPLYGQALAGGGTVVLYVALYAALHFYALIEPTAAFVAMVGVTGLAGWLADRERAQPLAMLALLGGFATPLLVGGERGAQVVLFTYVGVLAAAAVLLARRRQWPLLSAAGYVGTFALVVIWAFASYEPDTWLRTHLFLTGYAALFGYALFALLRSGDRTPEATLAAAALATAPLVYHLASMILLAGHPAAWLLYVALATLVAVAISHRTDLASVRVLALVIIGLPAAAWLADLQQERWYAAAVVTMLVLYGLHLIVEWDAAKDREGHLPAVEAVHTQLNGLLLPAALYAFVDARFAAWNPWVTGVLAAWNLALALAARRSRPALDVHHRALGAVLVAVTIVLALDGPAVAAGWVAEGVFLLWIALRERSRALGAMGAVLIPLGATQLAFALADPLDVNATPVLNARALATAVSVALLAFVASRMTRDPEAEVRENARDVTIVLANVLLIGLLSAEVIAFFDHRAYAATSAGAPLAAAGALQAGQVALSVTWALYAVGLIAAGIRRAYTPARLLGIILFGVTLLKVWFRDIAELGRVERMLAVIGVGVLLLVASYLYQRYAAPRTR